MGIINLQIYRFIFIGYVGSLIFILRNFGMEIGDNLPRIRKFLEKKKKGMRGPRTCSKIRLRQALRILNRETREYFYDTSLHGFKYITSSESTYVEKIIWITTCAVGTIFCIILMCLVWQRFQENPTVTTIETTSHPIWELPFPAVTICNFNKIYLPRVYRFVEEFKSMGLNETDIENFFESLPKLIRPEYVNVDVAPGLRALALLGYSVEDFMQMLMQPCNKLLVNCAWLGRTYDCSKMFQMIKSIEGFCCSFNYHALMADFELKEMKWFDEFANDPLKKNAKIEADSIAQSATIATEPFDRIPGTKQIQMVAGSGRDVGLSVIFDLEGEFNGGGTRPYKGASILIHDPQDYPEISVLTALAEPGKEIDISITGTIIESVDNIRGLRIEQRKCLFDDEAGLRLTKEYSYQTCVTECRINQIKKLCNCVPFYYPNLSPDDTRTCDLTDVKCMRDHRRILSSLQASVDSLVENRTIEKTECNCMPQCSDKWYSIATETADIKGIKYDQSMFYGLDIRNLSSIYVYFRDITCLKYRKDILMTWDGFFASFGGIFGLCLGGSMISLVELIYYYFVRIFHGDKKSRRIVNGSINDGTRIDGRLDNFSIFNNNYQLRLNKCSIKDSNDFSKQLEGFGNSSKFNLNYLE